jgi:hypothetical protein
VSLNRYATKRDAAEPPIIDALEKAGFDVWPLDEPADLACRRPSWAPGIFQLLEVKTGRGKNLRIAKDKRQRGQQTFLEVTRTPVVRTPIEALRVVNAIGEES